MKIMPLEKHGISNSRLVLGCMGLGGSWDNEPYEDQHVRQAQEALEAALSIGITMYDHADIYTRGKAEAVFGQVLKQQPGLREKLVLQSKVGIRLQDSGLPTMFDFSREYILKSVDGILQRLGTDYLDILLLHRPDPLVEPGEVAEAFSRLKESGKVRHFGVSNMHQGQIRFLQRSLPDPLVINQLEMSLAQLDWLDQGVHVNQKRGIEISFEEGLMEFMQMENIQIQSWGSLAQGRYSGKTAENASEADIQTAKLVSSLAEEYETTSEAVVLGWLMRHPACIQPVIGTANPKRILACQDAVRLSEQLTREQWWTLYISSRGEQMP